MAISCVINLFFKGHMEYARLIIVSSSVGDLIQSWLFHLSVLKGIDKKKSVMPIDQAFMALNQN